MKMIDNQIVNGLIGLLAVLALIAALGLPEGTARQNSIEIPAIKMEPASKAVRPQPSAGTPVIVEGGLVANPSQIVPPAISPLVDTVVVPKGASCVKLFGITVEKCIEQAEKAGRVPVWHRDAAGRTTIDVPLIAGEIVYMLRNTETGEVLPYFQPEDGGQLEIAVEPDRKPSR